MARSAIRPLLTTLAACGVLAACAVAPPAGPTVLASPPQGKDLGQFQQEDAQCRAYALGQAGMTPQQAANTSALGSAAVGTALGAAAGALIGSAGAAAGAGAAIGAGTGLLVGSAAGTGAAAASGNATQAAYDAAYAQCMTGAGNTVTAGIPPGPASAPMAYAPPYYGPVPAYPYSYYYGPSVSVGIGYGWGWGRPWGPYRPWGYYRPWGWRPYGYGPYWRRW